MPHPSNGNGENGNGRAITDRTPVSIGLMVLILSALVTLAVFMLDLRATISGLAVSTSVLNEASRDTRDSIRALSGETNQLRERVVRIEAKLEIDDAGQRNGGK